MALIEVETPPFRFPEETVIIYKGFRVSRNSDGVYSWKDVRFSDYYEDVDPLITEKILELGFVNTLTMVMVHSDEDKLVRLNRRIINIDLEISYWVNKATQAYNDKKRSIRKANSSKSLSESGKKKKIASANRKYEKDKKLYEKKRRVLSEEKETIKLDLIFYENRINLFKGKQIIKHKQ